MEDLEGYIFFDEDWDAPIVYRNEEDMYNGKEVAWLNVGKDMLSFVMINNKLYFAENVSHYGAIENALLDIHHLDNIEQIERKFKQDIDDICEEVRYGGKLQIEGRFWFGVNIFQVTEKRDKNININDVIKGVSDYVGISLDKIYTLTYESKMLNGNGACVIQHYSPSNEIIFENKKKNDKIMKISEKKIRQLIKHALTESINENNDDAIKSASNNSNIILQIISEVLESDNYDIYDIMSNSDFVSIMMKAINGLLKGRNIVDIEQGNYQIRISNRQGNVFASFSDMEEGMTGVSELSDYPFKFDNEILENEDNLKYEIEELASMINQAYYACVREDDELYEGINEKAKSKAQQRFFGMVRAYQKGDLKGSEVSKSVKDAAKSMKKKDVKDFAETKHKGLPNHVKKENISEGIEGESVYTMDDWRRDGELNVKKGQYIASDVYYELLGSVPPRFAGNGIIQYGEPYDMDDNYGALYRTFKVGEHDGKRMWQYVGLKYGYDAINEGVIRRIVKENIKKYLTEEYSSMGGLTDEDDINRFIEFTNKYVDLPGCAIGFNSSDMSIDNVLMLYRDLLYKVSNAMGEETYKSSYHWFENIKKFLDRDENDKANYSYKKSYEIALEGLKQKNLYSLYNMKNIHESKEDEMDSDWMDIESWNSTNPTDGAYEFAHQAGSDTYGKMPGVSYDADEIGDALESNDSNYNIVDDEGYRSMSAMDRMYRSKKYREQYPDSLRAAGRGARGENPFDSDNTFDDEIQKYGLNMDESRLRSKIHRKLNEMICKKNRTKRKK